MARLAFPLTFALCLCACTPDGKAPETAPVAQDPPAAQPTPSPSKPEETPAPSAQPPEADQGTRPDDASTASVARWDGYASTRFGMDVDAFRAAYSGTVKDLAEDPACHHLMPAGNKTSAELAFMFVDGKFARYSTTGTALVAPGGGRVGMTADALGKLYGRLDVQPHKYTDGKYLRATHDKNVLIFATDPAGKVVEWRVGRPPAVDYVEGCA